MAILVFAEVSERKFKKAAFEAINYAAQVAAKSSDTVVAAVIGDVDNASELGMYGAQEVITAQAGAFQAEVYSEILANIAKEQQASVVVISNSYAGKAISGRVAVKLNASLATNVIGYPETGEGFKVKRGVFSGKAFGYVSLTQPTKVLAITPNSFETVSTGGSASVSNYSGSVPSSSTEIVSVNTVTGKIPLTEAEVVISGGRGMKGPENWSMIEELADILGGATACSKPVSDMHWRPHSEHVGQTGITIKPNLYIAIGISGAIQHLAGVSSSKVIVAINKDPEAPFFKAADYGIVGDAFDVLPKILEAAKAAKA